MNERAQRPSPTLPGIGGVARDPATIEDLQYAVTAGQNYSAQRAVDLAQRAAEASEAAFAQINDATWFWHTMDATRAYWENLSPEQAVAFKRFLALFSDELFGVETPSSWD